MVKNGKKVTYLDSNNYVLEADEENFVFNSVSSQMPDKIRYYSKNFWTFKKNNLSQADKNNVVFTINHIDNSTIELQASKDKFFFETFENGILTKKFSRDDWESFVTSIMPFTQQYFEDNYTVFPEPINIAELEDSVETGISFVNKEYYYNFYSQNFEAFTGDQFFDATIIPSAFALLNDQKLDVRTEEENLLLSLGGFIDTNIVDSLQTAKEMNNNVKKYFEDFVDVCKNSEALPVLQRIKSQPTDIIISKEKNNLTKKVDKTFIPFPYYFFAEFTNLSPDKNDLTHVIDDYSVSRDLLKFIIEKENIPDSKFIYSGEYNEERTLNYYDLKEFLSSKLASFNQPTDDITSIGRIVSYTDLIKYVSDNIKNKKREYKDLLANPCHNEVLFYKIEKRQFNYSSNILQTFWLIPDNNSIFKFFDTQIKYGTEYFYTISAFTLVVGTKYTYKDYEYDNDLFREADLRNGKIKLNVETSATYKIFEVPFAKFSNAVIEPLYTKPIPKIELQNDILRFSFDQSETISLEDPFIIENKDFKIFQDIKRFQQNDDISLLKSYINRDPSVSLQIYRTTQRPTKYTSFQGNLYKTLKLNSNSNSFFDTISKNVKYYYLFRYLNKHNLPSNSSKVLEIELIDEDDYLQLRQQEIVLNPDVPKALTKDMKKYLLIRPSIIQIRPNMKMGVENSDQIEVGPSYEKVWNKDFILRIKSKKTQRVLEFNLKSLINKKI